MFKDYTTFLGKIIIHNGWECKVFKIPKAPDEYFYIEKRWTHDCLKLSPSDFNKNCVLLNDKKKDKKSALGDNVNT